MYLNVITFMNGAKSMFNSELPYSVDKIEAGFNVVSDEVSGQTISFRGDQIVSIDNINLDKVPAEKPNGFTINK